MTPRRHILGFFSDKRKRYSQQKVFGYVLDVFDAQSYQIQTRNLKHFNYIIKFTKKQLHYLLMKGKCKHITFPD